MFVNIKRSFAKQFQFDLWRTNKISIYLFIESAKYRCNALILLSIDLLGNDFIRRLPFSQREWHSLLYYYKNPSEKCVYEKCFGSLNDSFKQWVKSTGSDSGSKLKNFHFKCLITFLLGGPNTNRFQMGDWRTSSDRNILFGNSIKWCTLLSETMWPTACMMTKKIKWLNK